MPDTSTKQLDEVREVLSRSIETLTEMVNRDSTNRFFPNGISKISFTAKFGGAELTFNVEGPGATAQLVSEIVDDPAAKELEHRKVASGLNESSSLTLAGLDLAERAKTAAQTLKAQFPAVVFTSGRRNVAQQASAMAGNIVGNRKWVEQTYAASTERDALQKWVDDHPAAGTVAEIAAGLSGIMSSWTDAQKLKLSRHFAGLAFDVQPTGDTKLKDAIKALPDLVKFLDSEGGATIWHAEFKAG